MPSVTSGTYGEVYTEIGLEEGLGQAAEIAMYRLAAYTEDLMAPLLASRRIAMDDMQAHFDSESDPEGNKWVDLDPDYEDAKNAGGFADAILVRTGEMMAAATSEEAFMIVGDALIFNTDVLPQAQGQDWSGGVVYGLLHQRGTGEEGNWGFNRITKLKRDPSKQYMSDHVGIGIGRGNNLPRRAFIGLSPDGEIEINMIFEKWFAEAANLFSDASKFYVRPSGVVQSRIKGRFGPKVATL